MRLNSLVKWLIVLLLVLLAVFIEIDGQVSRRFHEESEARDIISRYKASQPVNVEYDIVAVENYLRNYRHGPQGDNYMLFNYDLIGVYVGPYPKGHPNENDSPLTANGIIRTWAMFDSKTNNYCDLNGVHQWGQLALFSCRYPGVYRAYAIQTQVKDGIPRATRIELKNSKNFVLGWFTRTQKEPFSLLTGHDIRVKVFELPSSTTSEFVESIKERTEVLKKWALGQSYDHVDKLGQNIQLPALSVVMSDPIRIKETYYCYYWMYTFHQLDSVGYSGTEITPADAVRDSNSNPQPWTAYIMIELFIWIGEPSGVGYKETIDIVEETRVSDYSKILTKRFSETGLFPCLRKAHSAIEVVKETAYISETDNSQHLRGTPHWTVTIKVHTDRLVSTLSDISLTIASRQNTGSFHCFVGDTRVFIKLRNFDFVPMQKLQLSHVNLNVSNLDYKTIRKFRFGTTTIYGQGVHYIGNKRSKFYQPASSRTDMVVVTNPCIAQEFAISVGGSLYIAEAFLRKGVLNAKKVVLPFFADNSDESSHLGINVFLQIADVAFTPTHLAFLMNDGYVYLHSSSASKKGVAKIHRTQRFRPDAFVKRRWCSRTASPKLSSMILPIFSGGGSMIILQIYPTEGNVPMWITSPNPSCLPEAAGFVKKVKDQTHYINETDIHYQEFASVVRTNQKTGLVDPPVASRPPPPPPPDRDIFEETSFILDSSRKFVVEGEDPHFPPELIDPASHELANDLKDYNQAKVYKLKQIEELSSLLTENGFKKEDIYGVHLAAMEFTAMEKTFIFALSFGDENFEKNIFTVLSEPPFLAIITTITTTNFPYRVKIENAANLEDREEEILERLDTVVPFPGALLVRLQPYKLNVMKSRDHQENIDESKTLGGNTKAAFVPVIHTLRTSSPTYIIDLGNVLVYSSIENRYARPLHYFTWDKLDDAERLAATSTDPVPLFFTDSTVKFEEQSTMHDIVLTEQGMISVLRRKEKRHLIQDDEDCLITPDTETQKVIMGSVVTLEGLREVKPFFRNDNIFQRSTPDGEIVYGTYDVKPRSSFPSCNSDRPSTKEDTFSCVEQPTETISNRLIPVCTRELESHDKPCRDPGYLEYCEDTVSTDPKHACLRKNKGCRDEGRISENDAYIRPSATDPTKCDKILDMVATECLPKRAPREDIRTVNILGTSYHSYLQGSLESVRTLHPEANVVNDAWKKEVAEELDLCPFVQFEVYHKEIDFAEVGYQVRVTALVSYIGTGIPTEADVLVEFEQSMGVVIEISTSVEEVRQLTRVVKAVDIHFHMPDYKLDQLMTVDPAEKHRQRALRHDFDDIRAREKFSEFSITFRPSIVNTRCKSTEFFKTVQFNVGCNAFSSIRLMSEATTLKKINWTETLDEQSGFQWHRDYNKWNLTIPKVHIFYKQLKNKVFNCDKNPSFCEVPYFHLFKNDIYTLSYRDYFLPKFEQFLTFSSRPVTANMVLYDMLGSDGFNWTLNKYKAGCINTAHFWYQKLLHGTKEIGRETFEHENVYIYYKDCFDEANSHKTKELSSYLLRDPFYFFNKTNQNSLKFSRNRNEIFIFRAVAMNTYYNRFSYCRQLDTFFMVRITGIPIPRQGLHLWQYILTILLVLTGFVIWYFIFARFYTWTVSRT